MYIGDIENPTSERYQIIDSNNCDCLCPGVYYTSISDLKITSNLAKVFSQADTIVYCAPKIWSSKQAQQITEQYLVNFADKKIIQGFSINAINKDAMLALKDSRKSHAQQLWVAGCSITAGVGVEQSQRYGQLLADSLNLPVSFLAQGGSSIAWAADQILRSDIRPGDTVVWGITNVQRYPLFVNGTITQIYTNAYIVDPSLNDIADIDFLDSEHLVYRAVTEIHKVLNFCNKLGVKLILAELIGEELCAYLHNIENFVMLFHQFGSEGADRFLDRGTDQTHPGPKMHQYYHDQILKKLNKEVK